MEDIEDAKSHMKWLLNDGFITKEDKKRIKILLNYIDKLERENKNYKYDRIPYLEGYIRGMEAGINSRKEEKENGITEYKIWMNYEDYEHPFGLGYDYSQSSYTTNHTKGEVK